MNRFFCIILLFVISGCATLEPPSKLQETLNRLDQNITQVVFVHQKPFNIFNAQFSAWQKENGQWRQVLNRGACVVGRKGIAPEGEKREGDGRTPSGNFKIYRAFGYSPNAKTNLDYRQATENDFWIDDVDSPQYNEWISGEPAAQSFERLKRDDDLYKYGIVIEYNTDPVVRGMGSAIFLHIWRGPHQSTAGCVAMDEQNLVKLLKWLDKFQNPIIIIKPSSF